MKFSLYTICLCLMLATSCVKDKPVPLPSTTVNLSNNKKVFIVNEGNFMNENADISLFDTGNQNIVEKYYYSQNNNALGDVAQSINKINNAFYIVVNNSNKIVVCDQNFKLKQTINGLTSPRYILQVSNQKAYVSDLYANAISVVDLNSGTKTGSIPCSGKTEQMVIFYNKVFVTNTESKFLYVINTTNNLIEDSVEIGFKASSLVLDKNDKLWVLPGESSPIMTCNLIKINPINLEIEQYCSFNSVGTIPSHLCINGTKDTLYFLQQNVMQMPINKLAPTIFINKGNKNFYGLGVHPTTHDIYVADALDYVQKSNIYIYSSVDGTEKKNFKAGINANGFYFE